MRRRIQKRWNPTLSKVPRRHHRLLGNEKFVAQKPQNTTSWDEQRIEEALFGDRRPVEQRTRVLPDFPALREQLQRHPHLTLQLAWEEYRQVHPEGYGYSRFCELYERWRRKQAVVLRQEHKPGEKGFVDRAGATIPVQDPVSGEIWQASLFVMVLGASSYTYAEATRDQQLT
ncbi:MAG: hypothetical protein QOH31_1533, partial [Verrucomicrobiota bacterium]